MTLAALVERIDASPLAVAIRESPWLFPTIETLHVMAVTVVVGSIAMLDLRLLGWRSRERAVTALAAETLPWTWTSFGFAVLAGSLLFISAAPTYVGNREFRLKMCLLLLAGLNMVIFRASTWRSVESWDRAMLPPGAARLAGGLSLAFWVGVVACGRWVGFTRL